MKVRPRQASPFFPGLSKLGKKLFPAQPPQLNGLQPALAGGPQFPFPLLLEIGAAGGGGGAPKLYDGNLREDLIGTFKSRGYKESELLNLEKALTLSEKKGIDLSQRIRGIELLVVWDISPDAMAAFILSPAKMELLAGEIEQKIVDLIGRKRDLDAFRFDPDQGRDQGHNYLRMLMIKEPSPDVMLLKTAELFLELTQNAGKQSRSAYLALHVYGPLLTILNYKLYAEQLENIAFLNLNPKEYEMTENNTFRGYYKAGRSYFLKTLRDLAEDYISVFINVAHTISWRLKDVLSISAKKREVNDLLGIRLVVPTEEDCWKAQAKLVEVMDSANFERVSGMCDNYIRKPTATGYRALHETYEEKSEKWKVEIQIRSEEMDRASEVGGCSHLKYKLGKYGFDDIKLEAENARKRYEDNRNSTLASRMIYAYDADGRIHKIGPVSSPEKVPTVLDFAFHISRDSGSRCMGAEIYSLGKAVAGSFAAPIHNGDVVILKYDNKPQPVNDHRYSAASTDLASSSLGLIERGVNINNDRLAEQLKDDGDKAFNGAVKTWQQEIIGLFQKATHRRDISGTLRYSMDRVFRKKSFQERGDFFMRLGLLAGAQREAYLNEAMQIVKESSVVTGAEIGRGESELSFYVISRPGVLLNLIRRLKEHGIDFKEVTFSNHSATQTYNLLKIKVRTDDREKIEKMLATVENVYHKLPQIRQPTSYSHIRLQVKISQDQLEEIIAMVLGNEGHFLDGKVEPVHFRKRKMNVDLKIAFPTERVVKAKSAISRCGSEKNCKPKITDL